MCLSEVTSVSSENLQGRRQRLTSDWTKLTEAEGLDNPRGDEDQDADGDDGDEDWVLLRELKDALRCICRLVHGFSDNQTDRVAVLDEGLDAAEDILGKLLSPGGGCDNASKAAFETLASLLSGAEDVEELASSILSRPNRLPGDDAHWFLSGSWLLLLLGLRHLAQQTVKETTAVHLDNLIRDYALVFGAKLNSRSFNITGNGKISNENGNFEAKDGGQAAFSPKPRGRNQLVDRFSSTNRPKSTASCLHQICLIQLSLTPTYFCVLHLHFSLARTLTIDYHPTNQQNSRCRPLFLLRRPRVEGQAVPQAPQKARCRL